ncbi:4a-hydroxytetrahydrobiopterin dehydratase [Candidatus Pacearchaeota archaeon]|nr:4a-hydroxytetrahydrobiopterin dehydratase [Candidatus Pacearchaeota archaeon]
MLLPLALLNERMSGLKDWSLDGNSISKDYEFANFREAMEFVKKIAEIAEKMNHHPDIQISYNKVKLSLTTHYEKGLTQKDFEVAAEVDKIQ